MEDDVPYFGAPPEEYQEYPQRTPRSSSPPRSPAPSKKKGGVLRAIAYSILITLLVFILLSPPMLSLIENNLFPHTERILPKEAQFTVERRIDIRDVGAGGDYIMDLPQPTNIANAQSIINMEIKPVPTERIYKYGSPWNIWEGSLGLGNKEDIITIKITAQTETLVWDMKSSGTIDDIPSDVKNQYTGDEWRLKANDTDLKTDDRDGDGKADVMINPSAPEIRNLAHNLADNQPDVYSKAKAIFNYMVKNFNYSTEEQMNEVKQKYGGLPKHALATLRDKWGDCDEQSMLYISLLRAVGIPARMEMGALYDQERDEWGGHAWVEVYIPSENGQGYWYNVDVVNDEFLIRDANRLTTWIDDGNGEHLDDFYHSAEYTGDLKITDEYLPVSYEPTGEIRVKVSNDNQSSMPGFESAIFITAISVAIIWRRTRR